MSGAAALQDSGQPTVLLATSASSLVGVAKILGRWPLLSPPHRERLPRNRVNGCSERGRRARSSNISAAAQDRAPMGRAVAVGIPGPQIRIVCLGADTHDSNGGLRLTDGTCILGELGRLFSATNTRRAFCARRVLESGVVFRSPCLREHPVCSSRGE